MPQPCLRLLSGRLYLPLQFRALLRPGLQRLTEPRQRRDFLFQKLASGLREMGEITLNERERRLRELLVDVAASIDAEKNDGSVTLRWAGGWVRDKLLGIESHDIDTAISSMTGFSFYTAMRAFCDKAENITKHQLQPSDIGNLHKIPANPDKSKHLETVTTRLFGLDIDFVNLRKETYSEDSRNPQMEFGTAEEDASRRDATINALFYNLHTQQVEDFTGGLLDLESKLIRTPMAPLQTFTDDPLRVLRLIRFAARLGFQINPEVAAVMNDAKVLDALRLKISRERIGVEVTKMLAGTVTDRLLTSLAFAICPSPELTLSCHPGSDPANALRLIDDLGLYSAIFTDPSIQESPSPSTMAWKKGYGCLKYVTEEPMFAGLRDTFLHLRYDLFLSWVAAAIVPWESVITEDSAKRAKSQLVPVARIAREGLRADNKTCDVLAAAHQNRPEIMSLKAAVLERAPMMNERDLFGMAIRRWEARDCHWKVQVVFAMLHEAMAASLVSNPPGTHYPPSGHITRVADKICRIPGFSEGVAGICRPLKELGCPGGSVATASG